MAFTIPNFADAAARDQAGPDSVDFDALIAGIEGNGVISGLAVTEDSPASLTVDYAAGTLVIANTAVTIVADSITAGAADPNDPRFDIVVVNSSGTVSIVAGTAASLNRVFPALPASSIILAALDIQAGATTIPTARIVDKRVIVKAPVLQDSDSNPRIEFNQANLGAIGFFYDEVPETSNVAYAFTHSLGTAQQRPINHGFLFLIGANPTTDESLLNVGGSAGFGGQFDFNPSIDTTKLVGFHFNPRWLGNAVTLGSFVGAEILMQADSAGDITIARGFYVREPSWAGTLNNGTVIGMDIEEQGLVWGGFGPGIPTGIGLRVATPGVEGNTGITTGIDILAPGSGFTKMGIRQRDGLSHNRFVGAIALGVDVVPAISALLDMISTTKALILPRMTTTQRDALTAVNGMLIYNTTTNVLEAYENGAWVNV